jgi:hypothetical protein
MSLTPDGLNDINVYWYFCAPNAEPLGIPSAFVSSRWDQSHLDGPFPIGESSKRPRMYYKGRNLWGYQALCHVGTDDQYANGLTDAEIQPPGELPTCCSTPFATPIGNGGLFVGGNAVFRGVTPVVLVPCLNFYIPQTLVVQFVNDTTGPPNLNGVTFTVTWNPAFQAWFGVVGLAGVLGPTIVKIACNNPNPGWNFTGVSTGLPIPILEFQNANQPTVTQYPGQFNGWTLNWVQSPPNTVQANLFW